MDVFYYNESKLWDHEYIAEDSVPKCHSQSFGSLNLAKDWCYHNVVNSLFAVFPTHDIMATFISRYGHLHEHYELICHCKPKIEDDARLIALCCYIDSKSVKPRYWNVPFVEGQPGYHTV